VDAASLAGWFICGTGIVRHALAMPACSILIALCLPVAVSAQLAMPPPEEARAPSRLAPLDPKSPWLARFTQAAQALQPALAGGTEAEWLPHFGGQWLNAADRVRIGAWINDADGTLRRTFSYRSASEFVVLGWQPPEGGAAYAALADRPEGDAIVCWRNGGDSRPWPQTAAEAEDRSAHACVRISYSVRFDPPQWRAFMDAPAS
jgi:hypothetical protein